MAAQHEHNCLGLVTDFFKVRISAGFSTVGAAGECATIDAAGEVLFCVRAAGEVLFCVRATGELPPRGSKLTSAGAEI